MDNEVLFPVLWQSNNTTSVDSVTLTSISTDITLDPSWLGKIIEVDNTANIEIDLPSSLFPVGGIVTFVKRGDLANKITYTSDVTIQSDGSKVGHTKQHTSVTVWFNGTTITLIGKLAS